ncbi:MAG: urea carboxylase [Pseudomonadota bacterium]|nr:urea carboxylase [Pseudomonadota bacterium]
MFRKVLIANRGAIAVRICRTLKSLGITSVAVYAHADRHSMHRRLADEAWSLGAGNATETYLNQQKLFEIAEKSGAEAIHPGYGFLSENADFVRACERRGLTFIGPEAEQIEAFGMKHTARRLAEENRVPLLPGTGLLADAAQALREAEQIGYPVILKSTAGGGGIGMQVCADAKTLAEAFDRVKRLGANNFAHDGVYLEKYIVHARHVEVQVFGDGRGGVRSFGERDCSAQRRHQKVLEETPAPGLREPVRAELHRTAERLMAAVGYRGAGTVEFIYDADSEGFWFLEVNTRLQVEHGVTEQVYGIDLVAWMVELAAGRITRVDDLPRPQPRGCSIQARIYAEDPNKDFQPSAGLLTHVSFPEPLNPVGDDGPGALRVDHWISAGQEVSPLYDPMLAMVIAHAGDRAGALRALDQALESTAIEGVETNKAYLRGILASEAFRQGGIGTAFLNRFSVSVATIDVLVAGTQTSVQDFPGRQGYWHVGVPPSGAFDGRAFRLANRLLDNDEDAAGLELTLQGPSLRFNVASAIVLSGAPMPATLDGEDCPANTVVAVRAGQVLEIGKAQAGARAYLAIAGGIACQPYLGSRSTFTLGRFGGHGGRALRVGDVLHLNTSAETAGAPGPIGARLPEALISSFNQQWQLHVVPGPHAAPDFFTEADIRTFFEAEWRVHFNSSRTGIRLIGPKPQWARSDGGEAGMHPSNIHDNAYAPGSVDYTGDMPVILGPDGPSLGGFVCPATVISADLWKLGQLKAGDTLRFVPVSIAEAVRLSQAMEDEINTLTPRQSRPETLPIDRVVTTTPVLQQLDPVDNTQSQAPAVVYRPTGDRYVLVEYGPLVLDIRLRFRVHALMLWLEQRAIAGVLELTPGVRSLQVRYDPLRVSLEKLLSILRDAEQDLGDVDALTIPSRTVHLPLSWNDPVCQQAVERYTHSVRGDAPWCPDNIEFIRRINGLESVDAVKRMVFDATYVVMGLGDVYLGAPVATPLDPRHRLVTTKYNPARTWTAENSVGIGGSYLCVYGMEGPGGYQLIGRTLQMWNRFQSTAAFERPWLLRFFDRIRFYEVGEEELAQIREEFPIGAYPLRIEEDSFCLGDYQAFLEQNSAGIAAFTEQRQHAFNAELARWIANGQLNFDSAQAPTEAPEEQAELPPGATAVDSPVAGNIWRLKVAPGDRVSRGQALAVLESMKTEIELSAPADGTVLRILRSEGQAVEAGQLLMILE